MGGLGVKVQHFPLTLLVVLTTLTLPCERDDDDMMMMWCHVVILQGCRQAPVVSQSRDRVAATEKG